jgi:hypothetical protein
LQSFAVIASPGPSRHFAATQRFNRFRGEADINSSAEFDASVENDPQRNSAAFTDFYRRLRKPVSHG